MTSPASSSLSVYSVLFRGCGSAALCFVPVLNLVFCISCLFRISCFGFRISLASCYDRSVVTKSLTVDARLPPPARRLASVVQQLGRLSPAQAVRAIHDG